MDALRTWREVFHAFGVTLAAPDRIDDIPEADLERARAALQANPEYQRLTREIRELTRRMSVDQWEMARKRAACAWAEST